MTAMSAGPHYGGHTSPYLLGGAYGLAAAALFGVSAPIAKLLLPDAGPLLLAGLLYFGAGLGLLAFEVLVYRKSELSRREAPVVTADFWLLAGMVLKAAF
jgi:drug/metabolite transporter (DMT)-like permease